VAPGCGASSTTDTITTSTMSRLRRLRSEDFGSRDLRRIRDERRGPCACGWQLWNGRWDSSIVGTVALWREHEASNSPKESAEAHAVPVEPAAHLPNEPGGGRSGTKMRRLAGPENTSQRSDAAKPITRVWKMVHIHSSIGGPDCKRHRHCIADLTHHYQTAANCHFMDNPNLSALAMGVSLQVSA